MNDGTHADPGQHLRDALKTIEPVQAPDLISIAPMPLLLVLVQKIALKAAHVAPTDGWAELNPGAGEPLRASAADA